MSSQFEQELKAGVMPGGGGGAKYAAQTITIPKKAPMAPPSAHPGNTQDRLVMILLRLKVIRLEDLRSGMMMPTAPGLNDLHTGYDATVGKVFVFLLNKGRPVVLEDDAGLFPSDALITQLILLKDAA